MPFEIVEMTVDEKGKAQPRRTFGHFVERKDAVTTIEKHIQRFSKNGYDQEQDYWWGRDEADDLGLRRFHISAI